MDFFEVVKKRQSVRKYADKKVDKATLKQILEAAIMAPSAGNTQPWRFIVIENKEVKKRLVEAALGQRFIEEAPFVIVVCADEDASEARYGERGRTLYCIQDTAAATENMLLAATALGLGSCWVGAFKEELVRYVLELPENLRPVAIVPIGYPSELGYRTGRKALKSLVYSNQYGVPFFK
ncbi:MAG: nitroreductase family protein [Candidatus Odinarchaeia archaeon]